MSNHFQRGFQILDRDTTVDVRFEHVQSTSDLSVVLLELLVDLGENLLHPLAQRIRRSSLHRHDYQRGRTRRNDKTDLLGFLVLLDEFLELGTFLDNGRFRREDLERLSELGHLLRGHSYVGGIRDCRRSNFLDDRFRHDLSLRSSVPAQKEGRRRDVLRRWVAYQ